MKNLLPALWAAAALVQCAAPASVVAANVSPIQEGYVDANGVLTYYAEIGHGPPLVVLHGGPGASHDYLLPWLLPLARSNQLLFIDERGSGRSERVQDVHQYTGTDYSGMFPNRNPSPFPLLDHLRVGLFDENSDPGEHLAPPITQFLDSRIYQLRRSVSFFSFFRVALPLLHGCGRSPAGTIRLTFPRNLQTQ